METNELITTAELADRLRVTSATVVKWRRQGIIPALRINATTYRFDPNDVLAALRARTTAAACTQTKPQGEKQESRS